MATAPEATVGVFASVACVLALASCILPKELRRENEATCSCYGFHPDMDAFPAYL